jgi:hypothetical protein
MLTRATQAVRAGKYFWATGFVAIAVLFNPVVLWRLLAGPSSGWTWFAS